MLLFAQNQPINEQIVETAYFEFHNHYWINLHHFLYQKAKGSQIAHLKSRGYEVVPKEEINAIEQLSKKQVEQLNAGVDYYRNQLIQNDLLRDLGDIRIWLQSQTSATIVDTSYTRQYTEVLNKASGVYQNTLWPIHKQRNEEFINNHAPVIRALEKPIVPKMEKLALSKWPLGEKVRVDVTYYANYSGAYTPTRPRFNIFISTLVPRVMEPKMVETIFHEGSHLLFRYGGPWRDGILEVFEREGYQMDYPGPLWHVALFYLCGKVCQDEFGGRMDLPYEMILLSENIFPSYHSKPLFEALDQYYQNQSGFEETVIQMLDVLNKKE